MQAKIVTVLVVTTKLNRKAIVGEPATTIEARDLGGKRLFIQHDERDGALAAQWLSAELDSNLATRSKFAHNVHFHLKEGGSMPSGLIHALEAPEHVYMLIHALEAPEHVYMLIDSGYFQLDPITPDAVQNLFRLAGATYTEVRDDRDRLTEVRDDRDRLTEVIIKPLEVTAS